MPTDLQHVDCTLHNLDALNYILEGDQFHDWATAIAFYAALHLVEAVLSLDNNIRCRHSNTHRDRQDTLKVVTRYRKMYKHYALLDRAARVARYAPNGPPFSSYLSHDDVREKLIKGDLWQIIKTARNFLKTDLSDKLEERFKQHFPSE